MWTALRSLIHSRIRRYSSKLIDSQERKKGKENSLANNLIAIVNVLLVGKARLSQAYHPFSYKKKTGNSRRRPTTLWILEYTVVEEEK